MSKKLREEMNKIEIPKELSERSKQGISQAKKEMADLRPIAKLKRMGLVATLAVLVVVFVFLIQNYTNQQAGLKREPTIVSSSRPSFTLWELANQADIIANLTVTEVVDVLEVEHHEGFIQEFTHFKATVNDYLYNGLDYGEEIELIQVGGPHYIDHEDPLLEVGETYILFLDSREDENLGTNLVMTGGPFGRYNKVDDDLYARQLNPSGSCGSSSVSEAELIERLNRHNPDLNIDSGVEDELELVILSASYPIDYDEASLFDRADLVVVGHTNQDFKDREHVIEYMESSPDNIGDYYTETVIELSEIIKQPSSENFEVDDELTIIEPISIISYDDGTRQKLVANDYQEIEKDDRYLFYLIENSFGDYTITNAYNGRFNLDRDETYNYVQDVVYDEEDDMTFEEELEMTHEKILEAALKRLE